MERKGICSTCIEDINCSFPRKFPVWECEEFNVGGQKTKKTRKMTSKGCKKK